MHCRASRFYSRKCIKESKLAIGSKPSAMSSVGPLSYLVLAAGIPLENPASQYAGIAVLLVVGIVTGVLAEREMKKKEELLRENNQLGKAYRDLQIRFEQVSKWETLRYRPTLI